MDAPRSPRLQFTLFALFALSGFAGLIYESIWSHYLKLFLGHAAHAQTLVLGLFMGGMAVGAWLAGRYMHRLRNPLLGYVIVEVVIGVFGLLFHRIFVASTGFMLDNVLPGMSSPLAIELARWSFAGLLILPQTLLLGATFPLMSVGILRCFPATPGSSIAMLYFTNSIGAVIGVLVSGFVLIDAVGLPGTILTAALFNFVLAFAVYAVAKQLAVEEAPALQADRHTPALLRPLLVMVMLTGLSSFIYEIGWIRMLVLVLGASTHAFELMLSAFILGLALGGLWVRRHIDRFTNPLVALGIVQLLMGLFALATVVIYNQMFGLMQGMVQTLAKTETGYLLFNMGSHLIAMLVMLPATFLAGMTLPLVTYSLLRHGAGESAIGKVYAFNTLGAILGVWLTVQFLMPMFGLKAAIMVGAGLDLVLGIYLLAVARTAMRWQRAAILASVVVLVAVGVGTQFDHTRMASGVFRHGKLFDTITPVYRQDGRTATVDVFDIDRGLRLISTNGKPDASVSMDATQPRSPDEPTMVLTGALPLLAKPEARTAAVIGMGSGISANVMLASPRLAHLDVIEIESAMVEGARHFGRFSSRVYNDPRSHIHIDDAKSYFAVHKRRYDLIVSEPSNPWVSGVANLFTDEFYARITHHLNDDGLLVQWFQLYETDPAIISSILKALGRHFEDYRIYAANGSDAIVVASKRGPVPALQAAGFEMLRKELGDVAMLTLDDVRLHEIGNRRLLEPMFALRPAPVNSDFFPFVDQHAVKARFLKHNFLALMELRTSGLPLPGIARDGNLLTNEEKEAVSFTPRLESLFAQRLRRHLLEGAPLGETAPVVEGALITVRPLRDCNNLVQQDLWQQQFILLASITVPHLSAEAHAPLSRYYAEQLCAGEGSASSRALVEMVGALAARDAVATEAAARRWLAIGLPVGDSVRRYVMQALVWSLLEQEKPEAAWALRAGFKGTPSAALELMWLHAQLATPQWRQ